MPSAVAAARNEVSSSIVSKVFRLLIHGCDEILVIFDMDIHDVMVSIGARGIEILLVTWGPLPDIVKSM